MDRWVDVWMYGCLDVRYCGTNKLLVGHKHYQRRNSVKTIVKDAIAKLETYVLPAIKVYT